MYSDLEWQVIIECKAQGAGAKQQVLSFIYSNHLRKRADDEKLLKREDVLQFYETINNQKSHFDHIYFHRLTDLDVNPLENEQKAWKLLTPKIKEYIEKYKEFVDNYSNAEATNENRVLLCGLMEQGYELLQKWRVINKSYATKYDVTVYKDSETIKIDVQKSIPEIKSREQEVVNLIDSLS